MGFRRYIALGGFSLAVALACTPADAACTLSVTPVLFGTYDILDSAPRNGVGQVSVTCSPGVDFTIGLAPGGSGNYLARRMTSGANLLNYNLYLDAARTTVWGPGGARGAGGSVYTAANATNVVAPVYGRIPAGQTVAPGQYADVVIVVVTMP